MALGLLAVVLLLLNSAHKAEVIRAISMRMEHIAPQTEVIQGIASEDSPCVVGGVGSRTGSSMALASSVPSSFFISAGRWGENGRD